MLKHKCSWLKNLYSDRLIARSEGGVLIGAVMTIVIMGALGAGMVSMLGTSAVHEVRANHGQRAFYVAESGLRFAESHPDIWNIDPTVPFPLPSGGSFTIQTEDLRDEYAGTASVGENRTFNLIEDSPETHYLVLQGEVDLHPRMGAFLHKGSWYLYRGVTLVSGNTRLDEILSYNVRRGADGSQTIGSGVNLSLKTGFEIPPSNGRFKFNNLWYKYASYSDNTLTSITREDETPFAGLEFSDGDRLIFPSQAALVATNSESITIAPMYRIISTGQYPGSGFLNARRAVTLERPGHPGLSTPGGGSDDPFSPGDEIWGLDNPWDLSDWVAGPGTDGEGDVLGDYRIVEEEGSYALHLQSMNPSEQAMPSTMVMFQGEQITASAYQVQIKIKLSDLLSTQSLDSPYTVPPYYLAGITFRKVTDSLTPGAQNVKSYGISFLRGQTKQQATGRLIPNAIIPVNNDPYIILWRFDNNPNVQNPLTLLAYAELPTSTSIINNSELVEPWSTLLVRVEQLGEPGAEYNRIMGMYGHHVESGGNVGNSNPFDQMKKRSPRNGLWDETNERYYLPWPPNNLNNWSEQTDYFTVVEWNSSTNGGATRHSVPVNDVERYVYIHTAAGENLFQEENTLEIGLHSWGHNLDEMLWFDDFGIQQASSGDLDDQGFPFFPGIIF